MNTPPRKLEWLVWGGLALIMAGTAGMFAWTKLAVPQPLPKIGQISNFTLTNQDNHVVSLADLRGKVWVADIIFTRCGSSCPVMTHRMAQLQGDLANLPVRLVTLTRDPEYDTPKILKEYAARYNADPARWDFLTGPEPEIRRLAVSDFKFVAIENTEPGHKVPEDLFLHSTYFVLVDQTGQVRGWTDKDGGLHAYFDSADEAAQAELLKAIKQLLTEKPS
jgi:protein SCO1/2